MTAWYDNAATHKLRWGTLCDVVLHCAQIKEDGMKTEAVIDLTAMTKQLTNQLISNSWFWAAVTCLTKRLLISLTLAQPLAAGLISLEMKEEISLHL